MATALIPTLIRKIPNNSVTALFLSPIAHFRKFRSLDARIGLPQLFLLSTRIRQVQIRPNQIIGRTNASDGADSAAKSAFALNTITGTALFLFTAPRKLRLMIGVEFGAEHRMVCERVFANLRLCPVGSWSLSCGDMSIVASFLYRDGKPIEKRCVDRRNGSTAECPVVPPRGPTRGVGDGLRPIICGLARRNVDDAMDRS
ncbi:hypothetical protein FHT76_005362 [Rhizobium sp. BK176]|nr:hypothetical protein [Rhizobium sp. BK176]